MKRSGSLAEVEALKRRWLKRIAQSPIMLTYCEGRRFSLQNGTEVPSDVAEALIVEGRLCGDKDYLFNGCLSQTFRVK
jgi:hypothetical protein